MLRALRLLARMKFLRGTAFDPFSRTAERRMERRLLAEYETLLDELAERLDADNHATAVELPASCANPRLRPCQGGERPARQGAAGGAAGSLAVAARGPASGGVAAPLCWEPGM